MTKLFLSVILFVAISGCKTETGISLRKLLIQMRRPNVPSIKNDQAEFVNLNFEIKDLFGRTFSVEEFRGKVIFLNFWATWCPPCLTEFDYIENLRSELLEKNVVFILVSREALSDIRSFSLNHEWDLPFFVTDNPLPEVFRKHSTIPSTFIIDKKGKLVMTEVGMMKWDTDNFIEFMKELADQ